MTILEKLYVKYGKTSVDRLLSLLKNNEKQYKIFYQYINLVDYDNDNNFSYFKSTVIPKLNKEIDNKFFLYEFINLLSNCDFTFNKFNTCITYGTFDLFHIGHLKLLKRIRTMCNNLIVGVSTDEFNLLKGKKCVIPFEERSEIVSGLKYVTKVIPENSWDQKIEDIKKYNVDCFIMGDDWSGKFDYLKEYCNVLYLPRTEGISTTQLKEVLKK